MFILLWIFYFCFCFFFFSSRRRHTRWTGVWSSDVCSSDLLRVRDLRNFVPFFAGVHFVHQIFVGDEAGRVIQQIANGDGAAVRGEFRENILESLIVTQLAVMNEEHDGDGGELFGAGGEAEIRARINRQIGAQVAHAVDVFEKRATILADENSEAGLIRRGDNLGENGIELRSGGSLRACGCEKQKKNNSSRCNGGKSAAPKSFRHRIPQPRLLCGRICLRNEQDSRKFASGARKRNRCVCHKIPLDTMQESW